MKKKILIIIPILITLITLTTIKVVNYKKPTKEVHELTTKKELTNNTVNKIVMEKIENQEEITKEEVQEIVDKEVKFEAKDENNVTEKETIAYFESMEKKIDEYVDTSNFEQVKDKASSLFITITDFIFYDGEIKGKKFKELSEIAKKKILDIYYSMDTKIENKWPNYKENIKISSKNTLTKASEKLSDGIKYVDNKISEKVGEEKYQEVKDKVSDVTTNAKDKILETYNNVKESETLDKIENLVTNTASKGKEKIKSWYENYKNKHNEN